MPLSSGFDGVAKHPLTRTEERHDHEATSPQTFPTSAAPARRWAAPASSSARSGASVAAAVEQELRLKGLQISPRGVRGVWRRHGLPTKHERLLRLEKSTAERKI